MDMKYFTDNSDYRIRIRLNNPISYNPEIHNPSETELVGVYIISVAARMLEMHPQTLRKYERLGLVRPSRTVGMLRLYSEEDIESNNDIIELKCHHMFHKKCLDPWVNEHKNCPLCKNNI